MFLKNKNIIFKIRRSKVTKYAALRNEFDFGRFMEPHNSLQREHSGSVVECLNLDRRAGGLTLTGITVLCP